MSEYLQGFIRQRARTLGMTLSEVGRKAQLSRQTLYALDDVPNKLPALQTIINLAQVLEVHPMRLLKELFDSVPLNHASQTATRPNDQSAFVQDVNFPDGALVLPGQTFVKTWEIQNVGQVAWTDRYLQCMDDDIEVRTRSGSVMRVADALRPDVTRIAVPETAPGEMVRLSVTFTAPATPGTVLSYWKSVFADGSLCFPEATGLWVKVRVGSLTSGASAMR